MTDTEPATKGVCAMFTSLMGAALTTADQIEQWLRIVGAVLFIASSAVTLYFALKQSRKR